MGYTNHYHVKKEITEFPEEFLKDVNAIIADAEKHKVKLVGWDNDMLNSKPTVNKDCIRLNGAGEEGCETFALDAREINGYQANFCKTMQLPYDAYVKAILRTAFDYGLLADFSWGYSNRCSDKMYRRSTNILKRVGLIPGKELQTYTFRHRYLKEVTDEVKITAPKGLTPEQVIEAFLCQKEYAKKTSAKEIDSEFRNEISWADENGHDVSSNL